MRAEGTPWGAWLKAAFVFGLAPDAFWRLSLKEWRALTAAGAAPFDRSAFDALAAQFPDGMNDKR
ncbi:MAG TPA: phage tail assembly chaperone [Terricaulis sp.]|nr:phage tail assembly chaperone [Terricaulis sp.]